MPVYRRTSPSLVICAEAVHSVNSTELTLISIRSPAGLSPLSSDLKSGPVYTVDFLVVEVVVTLLYSNRRLFLGDLVLECSKGVRKSVGNGLPLVGFPSWKWFEQITTLSLDFPMAKASIIWFLGFWNENLPTCEWITHFSGYLRSLSQPPTQHSSPNPFSPTKFYARKVCILTFDLQKQETNHAFNVFLYVFPFLRTLIPERTVC